MKSPFLTLVSICLVGLLQCAGVNAADPEGSELQGDTLLREYVAAYTLNRQGRTLGTGSRVLNWLADNEFELLYQTSASFLFLSDKRYERSRFKYIDGQVRPLEYQYQRTGTGKDRSLQLFFDYTQGVVRNIESDTVVMQLSPDEILHDDMSYQAQLRLDMGRIGQLATYSALNEKGKLREYEFAYLGEQILDTAIGKLATRRYRRVTSSQKRQTEIWLANDFHFVLARIRQLEDGKENYDIILSDFHWRDGAAQEGANPE